MLTRCRLAVGVRQARPRPGGDRTGPAAAGLRARWQAASTAVGWPFPSDWALPEVDDVCRAAVAGAELSATLGRLGRARAAAGAGLDETLLDLAAPHTVLPGFAAAPHNPPGSAVVDVDAVPSRLLRVTALGWAELALARPGTAEVTDALTGLTTSAYLRTRLREVYLAGGAADHVLVLVPRDDRLAGRVLELRLTVAATLATDPLARPIGPARVWLEPLPGDHRGATQLIEHLARW